jgi:hypothetical protein
LFSALAGAPIALLPRRTHIQNRIQEAIFTMRRGTALSLAFVFLSCFTVAVWAAPLITAEITFLRGAPELQSISGKIDAVGESQFTLTVGRGQKPGKLVFLIEEDTKFEGSLTIGTQATVDYRSEGQRNIATRVTVLPASGFQSY